MLYINYLTIFEDRLSDSSIINATLEYRVPYMPFSKDQLNEMDILVHFNPTTQMEGIKVHTSARPELVDAVKRLYEKDMVTQIDGGYLTELGREAAEATQTLLTILTKPVEMAH